MTIAPANVSTPYYSAGEDLTCIVVTAAVTGKTFVDIAGNRAAGADGASVPSGTDSLNTDTTGNNYKVTPAAAGARGLGVASNDAAVGQLVRVQCQPGRVAQVTAGATIAAGAEVEITTGGKVITFSSGIKVGKCLNGAVNNGNAEIKLY